MALLHQASRRLARRLRPASYCHWKLRAAIEMPTDTLGQVRVAPAALVCTDAERINRGDFSQLEPCCATNALGDLVAPTVDEEECAFLGAQNTRPTTIEMAENPEAEDDGVLRRDRSRALRARRGLLFRHWCIPQCKGDGIGPARQGSTTPGCVTPGALVVSERQGSTRVLVDPSGNSRMRGIGKDTILLPSGISYTDGDKITDGR